ncbi:MAG: sugar nucleotide-binding protein [Enterocloster sp.]
MMYLTADSQVPYTEFDTPNPQTVYGKSKLAGENFVREFCSRHIIIRSSWIFGDREPLPGADSPNGGTGSGHTGGPRTSTRRPQGAEELAAKAVELMYAWGGRICTM